MADAATTDDGMNDRIFITGATGFVGRMLVAFGREQGRRRLVCLARTKPKRLGPLADVEWVEGDLLAPESYASAMEGCSAVVHLAAASGKVSRARAFETNVEGTRRVLQTAKSRGVGRFLFISSVAAGFADRRWYPYADSKIEAERIVADSGMRWRTIRPTMIFGPVSPIRRALTKLARLPVIPVFGSGRNVVQPIHVLDLVRLISDVLGHDAFDGTTTTFGGRERLTIEDLLLRLRRPGDARPPRVVHLPIGPIRGILALLEPLLRPVLPLTAGQLATFANDGIGDDGEEWRRLSTDLVAMDAMVREDFG